MKSGFYVMIFIAMNTTFAYACDVCGCSLMGNFTGTVPMFQNNIAGVRYTMQQHTSHVKMHPSLLSKETMMLVEIHGRYYLSPKVQLQASLPFVYNIQIQAEKTYLSSGISDIRIGLNYLFFDKQIDSSNNVKHLFLAGGNIKLPTGSFDTQNSNINPNLRTGSGSFDFYGNMIYSIRVEKIISTATAYFKYNLKNTDDFRFGNIFQTQLSTQYLLNKTKNTIIPGASLLVEKFMKNETQGIELYDTDGQGIYAGFLADIFIKKFIFTSSIAYPLYQSYNNDNSIANYRVSVSVSLVY